MTDDDVRAIIELQKQNCVVVVKNPTAETFPERYNVYQTNASDKPVIVNEKGKIIEM